MRLSKAFYIAAIIAASCVEVLDHFIDAASCDLDASEFREVFRISRPVRDGLLEAGRVFC